MNKIQCPICYEEYTKTGKHEGKVLQSCGHTFCLFCLDKIFIVNNCIKCPLMCNLLNYSIPKDLTNNQNLFGSNNIFCKNCNYLFDQKNRICYIDTTQGCSFCKICLDLIKNNPLIELKKINCEQCILQNHEHLTKNFRCNFEFNKYFDLIFQLYKNKEKNIKIEKRKSETENNKLKKPLSNKEIIVLNKTNSKNKTKFLNNTILNNFFMDDFYSINKTIANEEIIYNSEEEVSSNSVEIIIKKINLSSMEYFETKNTEKNFIDLNKFSKLYKKLIEDNSFFKDRVLKMITEINQNKLTNFQENIENLIEELSKITNLFNNITSEIKNHLKSFAKKNSKLIKDIELKVKNVLDSSKSIIFNKEEFNILDKIGNSKIKISNNIEKFLEHSKILVIKNQILESNLASIEIWRKEIKYKKNLNELYFKQKIQELVDKFNILFRGIDSIESLRDIQNCKIEDSLKNKLQVNFSYVTNPFFN